MSQRKPSISEVKKSLQNVMDFVEEVTGYHNYSRLEIQCNPNEFKFVGNGLDAKLISVETEYSNPGVEEIVEQSGYMDYPKDYKKVSDDIVNIFADGFTSVQTNRPKRQGKSFFVIKTVRQLFKDITGLDWQKDDASVFLYLYRRFGIPHYGGMYKDYGLWILSTPMEGVCLAPYIGGTEFVHVMISEDISSQIRKEFDEASVKWREIFEAWAITQTDELLLGKHLFNQSNQVKDSYQEAIENDFDNNWFSKYCTVEEQAKYTANEDKELVKQIEMKYFQYKFKQYDDLKSLYLKQPNNPNTPWGMFCRKELDYDLIPTAKKVIEACKRTIYDLLRPTYLRDDYFNINNSVGDFSEWNDETGDAEWDYNVEYKSDSGLCGVSLENQKLVNLHYTNGFQTKRINKEQNGNDDLYFMSNGEYVGNAMLWHKPNKNGYTDDILQAGKFTKEEIVKFNNSVSDDIVAYKCSDVYASQGIKWTIAPQSSDLKKLDFDELD